MSTDSIASNPLWAWWALLCGVALCNAMVWAWSARRLSNERNRLDEDTLALRRLQLLLAAGYVAGCAYRSVVPVFDVPRQTLVDAWWSSAFVGRSVATVAELCFAAQWAVVLRHAGRLQPGGVAVAASRVVLPTIVVAEICSWYSVLSTSNLGHVIEESLWCLTAVLVSVALWLTARAAPRRWRALLHAGCMAAAVYAVYLAAVDVPMYATRWLNQGAAAHTPLGLAEGAWDAATRRVVSHEWAHWRGETLWMTLYFSLGVWFSLALTRLPAPPAAGLAVRPAGLSARAS